MDQFVLDKALLSQDQQDEILFALQATLATGGAETDTLKRLSALFRREGGDWLEADFTGWGSGAGHPGAPPSDLHLLQLCRGEEPPDRGTGPAGVQGRVLVRCTLPVDQWLASFLLSFGCQLEVLSPACWRDILAEEAKKMGAVYETGQTLSGLEAYPEGRGGGTSPAQKKEVIPMEERKFYQCCGMPLDRPEDAGTEAGGAAGEGPVSKSESGVPPLARERPGKEKRRPGSPGLRLAFISPADRRTCSAR